MDTLLENANQFIAVPVLLTISIIFRQVLLVAGQQWIATFAHTATLCTLPIITYVITSVIAGNIALSLGMVGALSIIRFRNPVKSPFELVVYFTMITMGIAAGVNMKWLLLLSISISSIILFLIVLDWFNKKVFGRAMFRTSFTEGNELATLEIVSNVSIEDLYGHPNTIACSSSSDGYRYVFASQSKHELIDMQQNMQKRDDVLSTNLIV